MARRIRKRSYFTSWGQDNADHDFTHGNGLRDTPWGYLISFRHLSQIALLRKKNLKKIWSVGSSADNDFIASGKARFDFQHSPIIDKNKNLILFDNGFSQKRSRILALRLKGKKAHFVWQFPKKSPYFSKDRGSIVAVNNGNLLAYFVSPNVIGEQEKPTTRSDYLIEFNPENQEELGKMQVIFFTKSPGYRAIPLDSINTDNYLKSLPFP
ncbi:MAG: arylsulfotransferase family protein [Bdellovibrionota bacterium]